LVKNLADSAVAEKMQLPPASVLYVKMSDELSFWIRPSGTEPKVKIYAHMGPVAIVGEVEACIEAKKAEIFSEIEKIATTYFKK
jgi:phosphomannomutase